MPNRYQQLLSLTPSGSFYGASGVVLPLRSDPYQFLFAPVAASRTFALYDNNNYAGVATSDAEGRAIVALQLDQGFHRITIIDDVDASAFHSYVTIRLSALIQAAHAEAIETIDASNDEIQQSLSLQTATTRFIEDVYGKPVAQPNDFGTWLTDSYRKLVTWLRQAFRLFGAKLTGVRQGVFAYTASLPLRVPRAWRPWWLLGHQLIPNGDLQARARIVSAPFTNLNARSVNFVHAAYLDNAPNIFTGTFANPPVPQPLRLRFSIGWAGGSVAVTGVDPTGVAITEVFTPLAAQPLVAAEDVDGALPFTTVSGATKSAIGAGAGSVSLGVQTSRFITLNDVSDLNTLVGGTLAYAQSPDRLTWITGTSVPIPTSGDYVVADANLVARFYGLVPQPGGNYAVGANHFLLLEGDGFGTVLVDLSNENYNSTGFSGGASPRTQAQVATSINTYFARMPQYGAVKARGTITCPTGAAIAAVDAGNTGTVTETLNDGVNTALTFQFFRAPVTAAGAGNILVLYTSGDTAATIASRLRGAVNNGFNNTSNANPGTGGALRISAASNIVSGRVDLENDFGGTQGNQAITPSAGATTAGFTDTNMTGGVNGGYSNWASAAAGFFSDAVGFQRLSAGPTGVASTMAVHGTGAEATRTVLGEPRFAAPLNANAATRAVLLDLLAGHRLPRVFENVILHAAFADSLASVTTAFTQPSYISAVEFFFDAAWRGATLRVHGTALGGATQDEEIAPPDNGVDSGLLASSTDGVTITLGGSEVFDGIQPGMFFRRASDGAGAYVRFVYDFANTIVLESAIAGFPWGPVGWTITQNVVGKGTLAFDTITQIDNLSPGGVGTGGNATLSIIDGATHGYNVRVGRSVRVGDTGSGDVTPLDGTGKTALFTSTGTYQAELFDQQGYVHIQGATFDSGTNIGLHKIFSVPAYGIDAWFIRHQDADFGGRFNVETLPGGADWRVFSAGEIVRVVGVNAATGDLTLYPPGLVVSHDAPALVELASELPFTSYGVDGPRQLSLTVDRSMIPAAPASDGLTFGGVFVPDGWAVSGVAGATNTDIPGYMVPARFQAVASGAGDLTLSRPLRAEDVLTYRGFVLRASFWVQAHVTGGLTFSVDFSVNGAGYVAGSSVTGSSSTNPQAVGPTALLGTGSSGVLDPTLVEAQVEIPFDATSVSVRIRAVGPAVTNVISVEKGVIVAVPATGLYVGASTLPLSEKRAKFGEVLYVWSPEALNTAEKRGLGIPELPASQPTTKGTIDRIVNVHGLWDRYDVSEYTAGGAPVNVLGAYDENGWAGAGLANMALSIGTPPRMTTVRPSAASLVEGEVLTFTAPSNAVLAEASAHEGPFPEESFDEERLDEGDIPVPATPSVGGGVLPWRFIAATAGGTGDTISGTAPVMRLTDAAGLFTRALVGRVLTLAGATSPANNGTFLVTDYFSATEIGYYNLTGMAEAFPGTWSVATVSLQVASVAAGDPPAEAVYNAAATYTVNYRRLTRATPGPIDLGASFADYLWLVDAAIFRRREPTSTEYTRAQQLTFTASYQAKLATPANQDQGTAALVRDTGLVRETLPVSQWSFVDQSTVLIDAGAFNPSALYSLTYQALLPSYPAPAQVVIEERSSAVSLAAVFAATWRTVAPDELVNRAHRYHQLRVTISGVVDVRDIEIAGLGLRGLHLYGSAPFAPGILEP